jgi:Uma2 family endonuclease
LVRPGEAAGNQKVAGGILIGYGRAMSSVTTSIKPVRLNGQRGLATSEEFLDWLEPGVHADLIGGQIFMHSPVHLDHARLTNFVSRLLGLYVAEEDLGELFQEVVAVRLSTRDTFLPDLAFVPKAQLPRLAETSIPFAPTLVVEVLSKSTALRDTGPKFAAYELHGVQEYWILDPHKLDHHFYRNHGGLFEEFGVNEKRIDSVAVRGFWVRREWLNPASAPSVPKCLSAILASRRRRGV